MEHDAVIEHQLAVGGDAAGGGQVQRVGDDRVTVEHQLPCSADLEPASDLGTGGVTSDSPSPTAIGARVTT